MLMSDAFLPPGIIPSVVCSQLAERPEARAEFFGKQLRLLPRGEMAAPVGLVEVDEIGVELLGPAARGPEDLTGKRREANRECDLRRSLPGRRCKGCGPAALPVRAGCRGPRSEERRVGKEWRSRWRAAQYKSKRTTTREAQRRSR